MKCKSFALFLVLSLPVTLCAENSENSSIIFRLSGDAGLKLAHDFSGPYGYPLVGFDAGVLFGDKKGFLFGLEAGIRTYNDASDEDVTYSYDYRLWAMPQLLGIARIYFFDFLYVSGGAGFSIQVLDTSTYKTGSDDETSRELSLGNGVCFVMKAQTGISFFLFEHFGIEGFLGIYVPLGDLYISGSPFHHNEQFFMPIAGLAVMYAF
jgi:hypothetical protein